MTFLSKSRFYFFAFGIWFAVLWYFSSQSELPDVGPPMPNFDKVMHTGYFFGGAILLGLGILNCRAGAKFSFKSFFFLVVGIILLVGLIDEFHQSHTSGRSGNDIGDLVADVVGGALGAWVASLIHPWVLRFGTKAAR